MKYGTRESRAWLFTLLVAQSLLFEWYNNMHRSEHCFGYLGVGVLYFECNCEGLSSFVRNSNSRLHQVL